MMWCVVVVCVVDVRVLSDEWIVRNWIDWIAFAEPVTHYLLYPVHSSTDNMPKDLLYPSAAEQKNCHKLKRLIQSPNSYFMDVKCPGCFHITTVFSNAQVTHFPSPQSPHSCLDFILLTWVYACSLICLQALMLCCVEMLVSLIVMLSCFWSLLPLDCCWLITHLYLWYLSYRLLCCALAAPWCSPSPLVESADSLRDALTEERLIKCLVTPSWYLIS
jgi:hypothetical protein